MTMPLSHRHDKTGIHMGPGHAMEAGAALSPLKGIALWMNRVFQRHESKANELQSLKTVEQPKAADSAARHAPLSPEDREINRRIRARVAGCDEEGRELGRAAIERDAAIISLLHDRHVVRPREIEEQMNRLRDRLAEVDGDLLLLDGEFDFMELGGHIPSKHVPGKLVDICEGKEGTYALLLEYVCVNENGEEVRVPFAYHFGFTEMPFNESEDPDFPFPNLDADDISGKTGTYARDHHADIWTPWRVGVVREFDQQLVEDLAALGVFVPKNIIGKHGTRRGLNNVFKLVYAQAAHDLNKEQIMYNTATLNPVDDTPSTGLPNKALRASNEGLFLPMGQRNHTDEIVDDEGVIVAIAEWHVFGNTPSSVLGAVVRNEGVLQAKGGLDVEHFTEAGHVLAKVVERRQVLERCLKEQESEE